MIVDLQKMLHFIHRTVLVSKCIANSSTNSVALFVVLRTVVFVCRYISRLLGRACPPFKWFIVAFAMVVLDFSSSPRQMYEDLYH